MKNGLVIPCFNFAEGVSATVNRIEDWRKNQGKNFRICFVDDSSTDSTHQILLKLQKSRSEWMVVLRTPKNLGKGAAVRAGFQALVSQCEFVFFTDCDLHYGLSILTDRFVPLLEQNDIVTADRSWVASSSHEAVSRRMSSYVFNRIMGLLTGVVYRDSQAGCKGFRSSSCRPLFERLRTNGFAFDVEILSIARFYRLRIAQVPVRFGNEYSFPEQSSVKLLYSSLQMLFEIVLINLNWRRGLYKSDVLEKRLEDEIYLIQRQSL